MAYLIRNDLENTLNKADLDTLAPTDVLISLSSNKAVAKAKTYIQHRYDPDEIFIDVNVFSVSKAYIVGDLIYYAESDYVAETTYELNARVNYNGTIYKSLQSSNIGNTPDTEAAWWESVTANKQYYVCAADSTGNYPENTSYFTEGDSRDQELLDIITIIAIFQLFRKIQPTNIPDWISEEFDRASSDLEKYGLKGTRTIILPVQVDEDGEEEGHRINYGSSETQKDWEY